jgi:hypothetical protein
MQQVDRAASLTRIRKKAVWGCGMAFVAVSAFTACEQAPRSMLGPTAAVSAGRHADTSGERWGAEGTGVMNSAATESGFACRLGAFPAEHSHATVSNSGNETVVCSGDTPLRPESAQHIEGTCDLHFGQGSGDAHITITPSGHVTLVCKSKG